MSTCKDCLHYEACKGTYYTAKGDEDILYEFDGEMYAHSGCEHFKNKADYTEVVFCEKCVNYIERTINPPFCKRRRMWIRPTDYCSHGERKEK